MSKNRDNRNDNQPKQTEVAKAVNEETKGNDQQSDNAVETPTEASPQVVEGVASGNAEQPGNTDDVAQKSADANVKDESEQARSKQSSDSQEAQQDTEREAAQKTATNQDKDPTQRIQTGSEERPDPEQLEEAENRSNNQQDPADRQEQQEGDEPFDYEGAKSEYGLPESWTTDQIDAWVEAGGVAAGKTESGSLKVNPERDGQPFTDWSDEDLLAALKGELEMNENKLSAVLRVYRTRKELPDAWSFRQAIDYFREGVEPQKTSSGVWVTDVTRQDRQAGSWETAELEAWAKGEIKATGRATDQKLAVELKNRLHLNPKDNSPKEVIASYKSSTGADNKDAGTTRTAKVADKPADQQLAKGLTAMNQTYIDSTLERYGRLLKPGTPVTEEVGGQEQRKLEAMIQYIINLQDPQAVASGLDRVVEFVRKNKDGLFSASHAMRFKHMLRNENGERDRHTNFIELLRIYTDENKEMRKQADVRQMLRGRPSDKQDLLVDYFKQLK